MAKKMEYEIALIDGSVESIKERLQKFANRGYRYVGSVQNAVIMERKARTKDEDEEGEEDEEDD
jgi:hypothetical protein